MVSRSESEHILSSSFDAEEYGWLKSFFRNIWLSKAPYKVFMARRAFNLNFAFMDMMGARYVDEYETENIMSNTALLLCAEEIAEYYKYMGRFPGILVVDDLLIHGRGIQKLIDALMSLVWGYLNDGQECKDSWRTVHRRFRVALSIYVFAQNTEPLLLDDILPLRAYLKRTPKGLRKLSQQISGALQRCAVANTSYVLSAALPLAFFKKENADARNNVRDTIFAYRGRELRYYYRNIDDRILETFRFYLNDVDNEIERKVTSLVAFGDISYAEDSTGQGNENTAAVNDFDRLCKEVADRLSGILPYSRIVEILNYKQRELVRPRAQMLSFLLSIFSLADFCRNYLSLDARSINEILLRSDYEKIAANFDAARKILFEVIQLFRYVSRYDDLKKDIYASLAKYAEELIPSGEKNFDGEYQFGRWMREDESGSGVSPEKISEKSEDIFYEVGMSAEGRAIRLLRDGVAFESSKPGWDFIQFRYYLQIMKEDSIDEVSSVGYALGQMDSGLFSMNLGVDRSRQRMQCILKAGELSTFVLPRRFHVLLPALSAVEQYYSGRTVGKREALRKFLDFLPAYCELYDDCEKSELDFLDELKHSKSWLLYMYAVGQSFQDWYMDLLTEEERLFHGRDASGKFDKGKYLEWESKERKREEYYTHCAKVFIKYANI